MFEKSENGSTELPNRTHLVIGEHKLRPVEEVIQVIVAEKGHSETEARGIVYGIVKRGLVRIAREDSAGEIVELDSDQAVAELLEDGIVIKADEAGAPQVN
ncbi:MAG TPA: hypothetical protein VGI90_14510 [Steroidobacteraceae bacterium]|jgi:hypothetical protein